MGYKKNTRYLFLNNILWNGKNDRIKHTVMIHGYKEGGLIMLNIKSFCCALKMSWIYVMNYQNHLFSNAGGLYFLVQRWVGDTILYLHKKSLEVLGGKLNPFWNKVFCNFLELKSMDIDICYTNAVLSQYIWFSTDS